MKKTLALLLALLMLATLLPTMALADKPEGTAITQEDISSLLVINESGTYYLDEDVTGYIMITNNASVTLDLNGHVLRYGTSWSDIPINVINGSDFTLEDSNPDTEHYFTYNKEKAWTLDTETPTENIIDLEDFELDKVEDASAEKVYHIRVCGGIITSECGDPNTTAVRYAIYAWNAKLTINGGSIVGFNAEQTPVNYYEGDHFVMNGGSICGNYSNAEGGAMRVMDCSDSARLELNGGSIIGNTTKGIGGGLYICGSKTSYSINGGIIKANTAKYNGGGGIVTGGSPTITMKGGTISGNRAPKGGGVCLFVYQPQDNPTMTVGGKAVITGNTEADGTTVDNLYLHDGKTVTVDTPQSDMRIGVTTETTPEESAPVSITGTNSVDYSKYFTSDNTLYKIKDSEENHVVQLVKCTKSEITVGEKNGTLTVGTAASATFPVTFAGFEAKDHAVVWKDGSAPEGVEWAFGGDNNSILTVSATATTPAGEYIFTVKAKNGESVVESEPVTFTVDEPDEPDDPDDPNDPDDPDEPVNTFTAFLAKILAILPALIVFLRYIDWII